MKETELEPPVERYLAARGYRTYFDIDGTGYFDAVALRGEELGLVELKIADWRRVFSQALVRRGWGDWVAVLLPRRSLAERVLARKAPPVADRVGVWYLLEGEVKVLREARPWPSDPGEPYPSYKQHLRESLAAVEQGLLPPGSHWRVLRPRTRSSKAPGRAGDPRIWRLDEFEEPTADTTRKSSRGS